MSLLSDKIMLREYLRIGTRQALGPEGTPLQYLAVLAHEWQCSIPAAVERLTAQLHRDMSTLPGEQSPEVE